ncbi:MAG TPA: efflux RND transporter periplasmic adaptor subunit [Acidobacteriota bacterium]|nr:efflux RND transporter periplasmic adaptor subunit [Acidobacteriota bacterium]
MAPPPARPAEVATITIQPEPVVLKTELPGRISAYLVAEIRPQVSGLLQKRLFEEGANVRQGDLLYQIDPAPYQAAYDQAKAALVTAQANVATAEANVTMAEANLPAIRSRAERLKELAAIHAVGQQSYDDAAASLREAEANLLVRKTAVESNRTAVEVNRAAVESARINLSYTPIKAPITGRIGKSNITVGAMVTAYQPTPLAVIQQLDPIYVDVAQANADLLRLRRSLESGNLRSGSASQTRVGLLLEDGTPYALHGTLQFRDVTVDPTTGSVTLRMVFPNPKQVLLPGMFVRAIVEEGVKEQALFVPQEGVGRDPKGNPIALIVDANNKVVLRALELDRAMGNRWLVTKGLSPGDRVIVEGSERLRPGATVRPVPFGRPAPSAPKTSDVQPIAQAR